MQFKQLQKKKFGTSTGFEPMAPALALQCSNQLSYEDPCIGSSPLELNKLAATYIFFFLRHVNGFWEENVMEQLSMLVPCSSDLFLADGVVFVMLNDGLSASRFLDVLFFLRCSRWISSRHSRSREVSVVNKEFQPLVESSARAIVFEWEIAPDSANHKKWKENKKKRKGIKFFR